MAAETNRFRPISRRYLTGTARMCVLLALAALVGSRSLAQSAPPEQAPPAQPATQQQNPAPAQPAPALPEPQAPVPDAQSAAAPAGPDATAAPAQPAAEPATAAVPTEPPPPDPNMSPEDKRKQQVAQQCADLLKLATDLKAQVDKSRKDELSVSVVRKATEIEQMAHKVRSGTTLSAGNQ